MAAILLSAAVLAEIAEYDRIVAFAEQVLAGTHPRVKIPQHLVSSPYLLSSSSLVHHPVLRTSTYTIGGASTVYAAVVYKAQLTHVDPSTESICAARPSPPGSHRHQRRRTSYMCSTNYL